jgi:hypothetical protein
MARDAVLRKWIDKVGGLLIDSIDSLDQSW